MHDLLYAFRTFWRAPAFALTAIVTFALGIGATTAMFSTVNAASSSSPFSGDIQIDFEQPDG